MRGLVGKFLTGAAQVAVPAAQDIVRQRFQEQRDAALQKYRVEENAANQAFTAGQNDLNRQQDERQNAQSMALQAGQQAIAAENLDLSRQQTAGQLENDRLRTDAVVRQADAAIKAGNLTLEKERQISDLRKIVLDRSLPDADRKAAAEDLTMLTPSAGTGTWNEGVEYGDETNEFGEQTKRSFLYNNKTAERKEVGGSSPRPAAGVAQPQTEDEYNALPSGALFVDPDDGQTYRKP